MMPEQAAGTFNEKQNETWLKAWETAHSSKKSVSEE